MKVALLTFFSADNYGAILQSYATVRVLEQLGHHVLIVNYKIPEPSNSLLKRVLLYPKHLKLEAFRRKHFPNVTKEYSTFDALLSDPPSADCYLVGSDQTWNPELSKDKIKGFFLDFGDEHVLRASYAPSFGVSEWKCNKWIEKEDVKFLLQRFRFISVREKSGLTLLQKEFGIFNVKQVLDPVFLLKDYHQLSGVVESSKEIILYKLLNSKVFYDKCKGVGMKLSLPVRSIGSIRRIKGIHCSYPESLEGWLSRIIGARFMITDSFHGTVLALLHGKQFCVIPGERITRIYSILDTLGLLDRIVDESEPVDKIVECLTTPIDYSLVQSRIAELRYESLNYINSIFA